MRYIEEYRTVQDFLDRVCKQVRAKPMHAEIREELLSHIEERAELLMLEGNAEEPAVMEAVRQMGEPEEIGRSLHMAHRPQLDWKLLVLIGLLSIIGLFGMLNVDYSETPAFTGLFAHKATFLGLGVIFLVLFYFLDYRKLKKHSGALFFITLCLMTYTLFQGVTINGQTLFLDIGPITIPMLGVVSCFFLLIALAGMKPVSQWGFWEGVLNMLYRGVLPVMLYALSDSMVYLVIYLLGFTWITWETSRNFRQFSLLMTLPFTSLAIVLLTKKQYLMWRLERTLDREGDGGYVMRAASEAVSSAGWFGHGFGAPNPRIPYIYSESVFTYLIYCFGWLFGITLGIMVFLFLARFWAISSVLQDAYAKHIVMAVIIVFCMRMLIPLFMGLGIIPAVSLDPPFISYGGTNQLIDLAVVGLILSIYRRKNMIPSDLGGTEAVRVT
ncbi:MULTISPECIES: FtsW/RodA/SpoVE family cell cycle protein [Paenibacillus]|uniref:FtsW/RodA/SpoVE family cell cycle protein n=1 Tax=Paenibacillus TaxID=44249 RepID=UPI00048E83F8|nr:FtsW/RodA/SpoVE family cell cycle protein [Paenibacillus sp. IHBB 10380]